MAEENGASVANTAPARAVVKAADRGVQFSTLDDIVRFAKYISLSGFAPRGMEKLETLVVAIEAGLEVGLPAMAAIQSIAVVNGRPALWGDAVPGVVKAHPSCEDIVEYYEGKPGTDEFKAVCIAKRVGKADVRSEFSIADAKRAGLWQTEARVKRKSRDGNGTYETDNDSPWYRYPNRMLKMRARGFACRDQFPDVLKGLSKCVEEIRDTPIDITDQAVVIDAKPAPNTLAEIAAARTAKHDPAPNAETGELPMEGE